MFKLNVDGAKKQKMCELRTSLANLCYSFILFLLAYLAGYFSGKAAGSKPSLITKRIGNWEILYPPVIQATVGEKTTLTITARNTGKIENRLETSSKALFMTDNLGFTQLLSIPFGLIPPSGERSIGRRHHSATYRHRDSHPVYRE
jgi:hypothetical protein